MNKKGFTLIELIAAITILGILTVLIAPNVIEMRNDVLDKSLQSKIDMIETAAVDYVSENEREFLNLKSIIIPENYKTDEEIDNYIINGEFEDGSKVYNRCVRRTVGGLIEDGYLTGNDKNKTEMKNPKNNQSLNGNMICIYFDSDDVMTRKIIARCLNCKK